MKKSRILILALGVLVLVLGGAMIGLASAPIAPHSQTIEKPIPDEQIPRKSIVLPGFLALVFAVSAQAQTPDAGKDASTLAPPAFNAMPSDTSTGENPAASAPMLITPSAPVSKPSMPPSTTVAPYMPTVSMPVFAPPAAQPLDLGKPVEVGTLSDISPESIGLFSTKEGGLGAAMWKGTSRSLVEHLLPVLDLPSFSPTLNNLAQRFLLTTADVPAGKPGNEPSLISLRVSDLIMLGDAKNAWKLVELAKPEQIDDVTLRKVIEAALVNSESANACAKLPDIIKNRSKTDWQEPLLVCQLMAKDTKAAQLTLDLMHTQNAKNDKLLYIAEHNIMGGAAELPRQLAPLKPLTLALLQLADLPLRGEVYAHPDTVVIPTLLTLKTKDDNARLISPKARANVVL